MTNYEYRPISTDQYFSYNFKAQVLLRDISLRVNIPIQKLNYADIIAYFQKNFNLHFSFYDTDPVKKHEKYRKQRWVQSIPSTGWIKYKKIIPGASFSVLDEEIVDRVSGFTIPDGKRTLIMINQDCTFPRLVFTILHELCHFYFHIRDNLKKEVFVSLTSDKLEGNYSEEMIPFEDEANNIGSMLFCSEQILEEMLLTKMKFSEMCNYIGMSEPAMHNRLLNYLEHVHKLPHGMALYYVLKFRKRDIYTVNLIISKIRAIYKEREKQEETLQLIKMQSVYVDKLKGTPFWDTILEEMNYLKEPLYNYYSEPKRYRDQDYPF
ncbi:MAG: ImmA/IrrE family metallo-endopeptidase [Enterococcus hulanensis]